MLLAHVHMFAAFFELCMFQSQHGEVMHHTFLLSVLLCSHIISSINQSMTLIMFVHAQKWLDWTNQLIVHRWCPKYLLSSLEHSVNMNTLAFGRKTGLKDTQLCPPHYQSRLETRNMDNFNTNRISRSLPDQTTSLPHEIIVSPWFVS